MVSTENPAGVLTISVTEAGVVRTSEAAQRLGSHLGSQSLRVVDVHGRPNRLVTC
jgi:hypothetical protein